MGISQGDYFVFGLLNKYIDKRYVTEEIQQSVKSKALILVSQSISVRCSTQLFSVITMDSVLRK